MSLDERVLLCRLEGGIYDGYEQPLATDGDPPDRLAVRDCPGCGCGCALHAEPLEPRQTPRYPQALIYRRVTVTEDELATCALYRWDELAHMDPLEGIDMIGLFRRSQREAARLTR